MLGPLLPDILTPPSAPTREWIDRLAATECPAITARRSRRAASHGGRDPIVWAEARGANVVDVEGNRYVDLSSGFGVSAIGHRHPRVVEAIHAQADRLVHAMGDLFPSREKIELSERIAERTPGNLSHSILGTSGADAVEAAIKTAIVATGRSRVLAFSGGYHGLSLGALGVSGYRDGFRRPFSGFAGRVELRVPYGDCGACPLGLEESTCGTACLGYLDRLLASEVSGSEDIAAVIVEAVQGRGGVVVPPDGWLSELREVTRRQGILLIVDEIYTGWGRTGSWFGVEHDGVVPDLMCVGKAMGGGLPVSAAVGTPEVMEAWGEATGEAIHTSTFLGNPMACGAAVAAIGAIEHEGLVARAAAIGGRLRSGLSAAIGHHPRVGEIRGRGSMLGIALVDAEGSAWAGGGVTAMHGLLERGFIVSPSGPAGDVIALSPPYVLTDEQADAAIDAIADWLGSIS